MSENEILRHIEFEKKGDKTTICFIQLHNGFELVGVAYVLDKEQFDEEMGKKIAYERAMEQIPMLEEYLNSLEEDEDE